MNLATLGMYALWLIVNKQVCNWVGPGDVTALFPEYAQASANKCSEKVFAPLFDSGFFVPSVELIHRFAAEVEDPWF